MGRHKKTTSFNTDIDNNNTDNNNESTNDIFKSMAKHNYIVTAKDTSEFDNELEQEQDPELESVNEPDDK